VVLNVLNGKRLTGFENFLKGKIVCNRNPFMHNWNPARSQIFSDDCFVSPGFI
jgi:hypothetical protein